MAHTEEALSAHCREILSLIGEDPEREGLQKTPLRMARALQTLTRGYEQDPVAVIRSAQFEETYDQMVIVRDIPFYPSTAKHT